MPIYLLNDLSDGQNVMNARPGNASRIQAAGISEKVINDATGRVPPEQGFQEAG